MAEHLYSRKGVVGGGYVHGRTVDTQRHARPRDAEGPAPAEVRRPCAELRSLSPAWGPHAGDGPATRAAHDDWGEIERAAPDSGVPVRRWRRYVARGGLGGRVSPAPRLVCEH